jgi:hypothetical protein
MIFELSLFDRVKNKFQQSEGDNNAIDMIDGAWLFFFMQRIVAFVRLKSSQHYHIVKHSKDHINAYSHLVSSDRDSCHYDGSRFSSEPFPCVDYGWQIQTAADISLV